MARQNQRETTVTAIEIRRRAWEEKGELLIIHVISNG